MDLKYIKMIQYIETPRHIFQTLQILQNYESLRSIREMFHKAERTAILGTQFEKNRTCKANLQK